MSRPNIENPSYITIVRLFDNYMVNLMKWDDRAEDYIVETGHNLGQSKGNAYAYAQKWAAKEGLEVR